MATIAASATDGLSAERKFYSRMALFMMAVIVIGFAPSFYLRGLVHYPRPNPTLPPFVMLHGLMFTTWLLLFIAQTQLVARGRRDLHIKLGVASMVLGVALIPTMYLAAVWGVARANQAPFTDPFNWTIVPLDGIIPFALMLWLGWARRRQAQWHKRAMLVAALMIMHPGVGRIPIGTPTLAVHAIGCILSLAMFVPLILWDWRTLGRLHPATLLGVSLTALVMLAENVFLATGGWGPIARHLPGVGV